MKSKFLTILKLLIGWPISLIALFFVATVFWSHTNILVQLTRFNFPSLVGGVILFLLYFFFRALFWHQLLSSKGHRMPLKDTEFLWEISELQRYIPGNIWSFIGRTAQFSKKNVEKKTILLSLLHEAEFLCIASLTFSLLTLNFLLYGLLPTFSNKPQLSFLIVIFTLSGVLLFLFHSSLLKEKKLSYFFPRLSPVENIKLFLIMFSAFFFFGLGNFFAVSAWSPLYLPHILSLSSFFTFSFLAGYLSFITPMGLGVREAIVTAGLSKYMNIVAASFVSIASRLVLIASEVLFLFLSYLITKIPSYMGNKTTIFWQKHKYTILICLGIMLYIWYFSTASFLRYDNFYTGRFDLGNMDQTVWNTIHGRIFQLTDPDGTNIISRLAFHADFFLILLAPLYEIWQDPRMLLLIQTLIVGAGSIFVYTIANKVVKNKLLALIFALAYLLNPSVNHANLYDFHAVTLVTTFLLGAWYFLLEDNMIFFCLFLFLAGTTKEEIWIITGLLGLTAAIWKKKWVLGTSIAVISFILFYVIFFKAIPLARGGNQFALSYYSDFGSSPSGIVKSIIFSPLKTLKTIFSDGQLKFLLELFSPLGFLSLFAPVFLIFAGPDFAIDLLSHNAQLHTIYFQYTAALTPFLFLGAIYGTSWMLLHVKIIRPIFLVGYIGIVTCMTAYLYGPLPGAIGFNKDMFTKPVVYKKDIDNFLSDIPRRYSVAATNNIGSHLSHRQRIFTIPVGVDKADIIVMLLNDPFAQPSLKAQMALAQKLRVDKNYTEIFHLNDFDVFAKKSVMFKRLPKLRITRQPIFPLFK